LRKKEWKEEDFFCSGTGVVSESQLAKNHFGNLKVIFSFHFYREVRKTAVSLVTFLQDSVVVSSISGALCCFISFFQCPAPF
jgi:hypothetical protein